MRWRFRERLEGCLQLAPISGRGSARPDSSGHVEARTRTAVGQTVQSDRLPRPWSDTSCMPPPSVRHATSSRPLGEIARTRRRQPSPASSSASAEPTILAKESAVGTRTAPASVSIRRLRHPAVSGGSHVSVLAMPTTCVRGMRLRPGRIHCRRPMADRGRLWWSRGLYQYQQSGKASSRDRRHRWRHRCLE